MANITDVALAERDGGMCDAGNRIPTGRFPVYATGQGRDIDIGDTETTFEFEAERDYLWTDLSVAAELADGTSVPATVHVEYCNTVYMTQSSTRVWAYCCQRKPVFLVGQRENKRLRITVTLDAANVAAVSARVDLSGFQGNGCCG